MMFDCDYKLIGIAPPLLQSLLVRAKAAETRKMSFSISNRTTENRSQIVRVQRGSDGKQVDAVRHRRRRRHFRGRRQRLRRCQVQRRGRRHRAGNLQQQTARDPRLLQEDVGESDAEEKVRHSLAKQTGSVGGELFKLYPDW